MKLPIVFLILVFSFTSRSATRLQFFMGDNNAMAIITPTDPYGNSDSDSSDLYQIMNVPEQDTMLGKGKAVVSSDRDFNLICSEYKNQCQVILNKSPRVQISSSAKKMRFSLTGEKAAQLTSFFKLNSEGEAYFRTTDKILLLKGNASSFTFEAMFSK